MSPGVDVHKLIEFTNAGGNLVITGTAEGSHLLRELALQVRRALCLAAHARRASALMRTTAVATGGEGLSRLR